MSSLTKSFLLILAILILFGAAIGGVLLLPIRSLNLPRWGVSTAIISASSDHLIQAKFNFAQSDQPTVLQLSHRLGVGPGWSRGISLNLDGQSVANLKKFLPATVYLKYQNNNIYFETVPTNLLSYLAQKNSGLKSSLASGNQSLNFQLASPAARLTEATKSGILSLTPRVLGDLWHLASKLTKIDLELNEGYLKGDIELK